MDITGYIEYRRGEYWEFYSTVYLHWWRHLKNIWANEEFGTEIKYGVLPGDVSIGLRLQQGYRVLKTTPVIDGEIKEYILYEDAQHVIKSGEGEWLNNSEDFLCLYLEMGWVSLPKLRELSRYIENNNSKTKAFHAVIATMEVLSSGNDNNARFFYESPT